MNIENNESNYNDRDNSNSLNDNEGLNKLNNQMINIDSFKTDDIGIKKMLSELQKYNTINIYFTNLYQFNRYKFKLLSFK